MPISRDGLLEIHMNRGIQIFAMRKNTLIVDSGATKALWSVANDGERLLSFQTHGIQPFFLTDQEILDQLQHVSQRINFPIQTIFFYGTGCNTLENKHRLKIAFQEVFMDAHVVVDTDILAAARACCLHQPGIACILGTGSNVCRFDGTKIVENAGGLGYILGDEGSGADLGKTLVKNYLEGNLPPTLTNKLEQQYSLRRDFVLHGVYQGQFPNRYMSTFAPFLSDHISDLFIQKMVKDQFKSFFERNVLKVQYAYELPIHFVGSVAYFFEDVLRETGDALGLNTQKIIRQPMDGLVQFHEREMAT